MKKTKEQPVESVVVVSKETAKIFESAARATATFWDL